MSKGDRDRFRDRVITVLVCIALLHMVIAIFGDEDTIARIERVMLLIERAAPAAFEGSTP